MKVERLLIEKKPSYDDNYPNMLCGLVQLLGEHGKQEIKLSSSVVSAIFNIIKEDCQRVAEYNASQTSHAIEEAGSEQALLEQAVISDDSF